MCWLATAAFATTTLGMNPRRLGPRSIANGGTGIDAEAASVGDLFHFKPNFQCRLLALSGQISRTSVCPLLEQQRTTVDFGQRWFVG
jgi:hypothetical protein